MLARIFVAILIRRTTKRFHARPQEVSSHTLRQRYFLGINFVQIMFFTRPFYRDSDRTEMNFQLGKKYSIEGATGNFENLLCEVFENISTEERVQKYIDEISTYEVMKDLLQVPGYIKVVYPLIGVTLNNPISVFVLRQSNTYTCLPILYQLFR